MLIFSDGYPNEPVEVIVIDRSSSQTTASDLRQFLSGSNQTGLMSDYLTMAEQWLAEHFRQSTTSELTPTTKSKGQNRRRKRVADIDEKESMKKESMKTADDVIKRILWDSNLESENFCIGYLDRFLGLMEKNFSQFSWEDLASVDYTVLAIPKHRIQYFKYRKVIVWDKRKRLDNVFGSAGCRVTIADVVANYVEPEVTSHDESEKCTQPDERSENGYVVENDRDNNAEDDGDDSNGDGGGDDDSDSDDGICVTIDGKEDVGEENSEEEVEEDRGPWQNKLRPNYFLCQRITAPEVLENVGAMQNQILDMDSRYLQCCIPPHMLHITICTLGLYQPEHVEEVAEILRENRDDLAEMAKTGLSVDVSGVGNFFERVVYGKVNHDERFANYAQHVCMLIREAGINICDNYEFVPHMTILKVTRPVARHVGTKKVASWMYEDFRTTKFGTQAIDGIYLCAMKGEKLPGKFYDSPAHISFV